MSEHYDAIVVGGGPAGATAALLLAQAGRRVVVIEKKSFPRRKVCGEFISESTWPLLRQLGVADELLAIAGPVVRRVGVFAGKQTVTSRLGSIADSAEAGGRALGREHLDTLLLQRAATLGAEVLQPWTVTTFATSGEHYQCRVAEKGGGGVRELSSRLVVAAHGSWESGQLPTQDVRRPARAADLFGFKAHFLGSALPVELMPLIAFPGGYGGMVCSDHGRVSLSCCVRRDVLDRCRKDWPGRKAGDSLLAHIKATNHGVAQALATAEMEGSWLSAGPLRTGIHGFGHGGIFPVGNAAGEAHPIVAEGISMAIQSAHLLCEQLLAQPGTYASTAAVRRNYERAWRQNFSGRLHVAAILAHLFMRPPGARATMFALQHLPGLLTSGARWSGKVQPMRHGASLGLQRATNP